jgi:hypothetical protein
MIDDECGAVGGMRIGRGNRSTGRKPAPAPLCPPQIPHDLIWARTWPPRWEFGDYALWLGLFIILIYTQPVGLLGRGSARRSAATYA